MNFLRVLISLFIFHLTLLLSNDGQAQFFNNGSQITVVNGGIIYVKGDLINADSSLYNRGKVVVEGNCIVKKKPTSRIVTFNGDSLLVTGDFKDSSANGQNTGTLVLMGSNQALLSTSHLLAHVVVNGAGDKTLLSNLFVRHSLTLKNGHLIVPNAFLFGMDSTAFLSNPVTANSFIVGAMSRKRRIGAEDSLFFPIGQNKTEFRPASLVGIGVVSGRYPVFTIGTNMATTPQPGLEVATIYKRVWRLASTDTTVPIANIRLYYSPADVSGTPSANLIVTQSHQPNGFYSSIGNKSANSSAILSELKPNRTGYFALGASNNLKASFKLFLEGPFNGADMNYNLSTNAVLSSQLLPTLGMLTGYSVPSNAVDRLGFVAQDSATLAYTDTAYAWLLSNGSIVDYATGSRSYVVFSKANTTSRYFIVAQHRNHLPASSKSIVMSAATPVGYSYDYSKGVYGGGAKYQLGPNVWTLYASDPYKSTKNQSDVIDLLRVSSDNDSGLYRQAGYFYYRYTDLNLDGVVNAADRQIAADHNNRLYYSTLK